MIYDPVNGTVYGEKDTIMSLYAIGSIRHRQSDKFRKIEVAGTAFQNARTGSLKKANCT
jgi:hypothetical protein